MEEPSKTIVYKNRVYHLNAGYYIRNDRLHQRIWEEHYGEIPQGYVIHHKNGITWDNRIENLECLTKHDHHMLHFCCEKQLKHLHSIRSKAAAAHRTPEARKKASEQKKKMWLTVGFNDYLCTICGQPYKSRNKARPKYCSQKCRTKAGHNNYKQKLTCGICGEEFVTAKGKRAATLCKICRAVARWDKIHEERNRRKM
jgi:hypothetical protein